MSFGIVNLSVAEFLILLYYNNKTIKEWILIEVYTTIDFL